MRVLGIVTLALACLLSAGAATAREHGTDGRNYLKRANALAGEGKCAAAVKDYTKAYDKLHDPIVLFNRAECYRRLGENAKAIDDYQGYLKGFPKAPNRADIENKIATLGRPATAPPVAAPVRPSSTPHPSAPPSATTPPPPPPVARPVAPPSVARTPPAPPPPAPPPAAPPPEAVGPMPFLPPPPGASGETPSLVEAPRSEAKEAPREEASSGSRWWLWTALAVVAVGGGVAGYLLLRPKDEPPPPTSLGHYRF